MLPSQNISIVSGLLIVSDFINGKPTHTSFKRSGTQYSHPKSFVDPPCNQKKTQSSSIMFPSDFLCFLPPFGYVIISSWLCLNFFWIPLVSFYNKIICVTNSRSRRHTFRECHIHHKSLKSCRITYDGISIVNITLPLISSVVNRDTKVISSVINVLYT